MISSLFSHSTKKHFCLEKLFLLISQLAAKAAVTAVRQADRGLCDLPSAAAAAFAAATLLFSPSLKIRVSTRGRPVTPLFFETSTSNILS